MHAQSHRDLVSFFWDVIRPYKWQYGILVGIACYVAAYASLAPYTLKRIIDTVEAYDGQMTGFIGAMAAPILLYFLFYLLWEGSLRLWDYIYLKTIPTVQKTITEQMFAYLQQHSHFYFQNQLAGSLANRIYDMSWGAAVLSQLLTSQLLTQLLVIMVAVFAMYGVHVMFAYALLLWAILFLTVTVYLSKKAQERSVVLSTTRSHLLGRLIDSLSNIINVRLFARQTFEQQYLQQFTEQLKEDDQHLQHYMLFIKIVQGIGVALLLMVLLTFLMYGRIHGLITIGDFALILGVAKSVIDAVKDLASQLVNLFEELGACVQALEIMTHPHDLQDEKNATPLQVVKGQIEFKNVTFKYERNNNIFEKKSITIYPGEKVGLVGFSGSGKTTFAHLILRYFDIAQGQITIDGIDIASVTQESLRDAITMIPQDTALFHRSLMENIRYACPAATDEQVIQASIQAHCHEFIMKFPDGYHTMVGERGLKLSGGQRQRIALARALLKPRSIVILDEATSSLDLITEQHIQEALLPLMEGRTTIVIAHRLSTLMHMDRILVFDGGHIVEDGTHEALLKKEGHYTTLWKMQAHGLLPDQKD